MLKPFLRRIAAREDLSYDEAREAMTLVMEGMATPSQIGAFVMGLRLKGESVEEVAGCAAVMREKAARVEAPFERLLDTCGTGGDGTSTFNISTAAAFVAAGAGARVAKHGNRAVSSRCGSADVIEALGIPLDLSPQGVSRCLAGSGIAFLFAPNHHAAMKHAAVPRREIGVRTVFNILGPLSNPAGARRQLIGVYAHELVPLMVHVLERLGSERAMVVFGREGLDEISISGPTLIGELDAGAIRTFELTPEDVGLARGDAAALAGSDAAGNAALIRAILAGREKGPARDVVVLNAAAGLWAAGEAKDLKDGAARAAAAIDSGAGLARLEALKTTAREAATG